MCNRACLEDIAHRSVEYVFYGYEYFRDKVFAGKEYIPAGGCGN